MWEDKVQEPTEVYAGLFEGRQMIQTQIPEVDAMIAELEAIVLGMMEANVLKAGEIARFKIRVVELEKQVALLTPPPAPEAEPTDKTS